MNVTGTIVATCTVSTAPLNFGTFSAIAETLANTTITVNCSNGTPYRIDIDAGVNYLPAIIGAGRRNMKTGRAPADGTNVAPYLLSQTPIPGGIEWGDNGATYCPTCTPAVTGKNGIGTGAAEIHTVYGDVFGGAATGNYHDTLTVTVNY